MSINLLNISCKKAAELMCKEEEHAISFWNRMQLSYHTLVCTVCRRYQQQDQWLKKNIVHADEHCHGCLTEADKQNILNKLQEAETKI